MESATAKPEIPVQKGDVLDGKYRVDSVLGVGGMGAVVAATHLQLAQKVAIKLLLSSRNDKDEMERLHRLLNEARVVAQMKSPHVARVLDVGTLDSGGPYMVMELLEGTDLEHLLEDRGSLPVNTAVDYVLQACEAVAEAHHLGVVHRDLKPSNLFLTRSVDKRPMIKVLDFGLSKSVRGDKSTSSITRPLEIVGTPAYMSPEQLRSTRDIDERTDIWSLGVILYELVTGTLPFDDASIPDLCAAIVRDPPRPITRPLPTAITETIERCLEKDPEERFADITELAAALAPFGSDEEQSERVRRVRAVTSPDVAEITARSAERIAVGAPTLTEGFEEEERPKRKGSRLGLLFAIVLVAGGGAGAGYLFIEIAARAPTRAAAQAQAPPPPAATTEPSASVSEQAPPPPAVSSAPPAAALSMTPVAVPSSKPDPKLAGMRPLGKPRPRSSAPSTPSTATTAEAPPPPATTTSDPNRFFETR